MTVWEHLDVSKAHVAYACIGVFSCIFSLVSLFVKERLYMGESTCAVIFGFIVGPHCLDWFDPTTWGNSDSITLEISRIVLCLQIFAVSVELPKKYMLKHWISVFMLLVPVMTTGWLIIGFFVWILIRGLNFSDSLLISACITATDPILAQSVVSGKFAERVPGHLRNLLSAESGCNDGMAFPFVFFALNMIKYSGNGRKVFRDWFCITILYECLFGCILGIVIGYLGRRAILYTEEKKIIDRESFLAFYVVLALMCAGFGSILGVDDLLVSFAAGTTFAWDGWFARKTEESKVSTVIDLLLNLAYFVYFGAIIPWKQFNDPNIGTKFSALILLAVVVITLRRIPAVMVFKAMIPDIKSWREALFVGHFGPIGVGAIFVAILAKEELRTHTASEESLLTDTSDHKTSHLQLVTCVWPIVCFLIVTSIIVHGSSVAVITLGRHLNTITLTKSFTIHTTTSNNRSFAWMQRLPGLDKPGRSFSLHRIDTSAPEFIKRDSTVETSGIPAKPAGGMRKRNHTKLTKKKKKAKDLLRTVSKRNEYDIHETEKLQKERIAREKQAKAAAFVLSREYKPSLEEKILDVYPEDNSSNDMDYINPDKSLTYYPDITSPDSKSSKESTYSKEQCLTSESHGMDMVSSPNEDTRSFNEYNKQSESPSSDEHQPTIAYQEGSSIILENKQGEIVACTKFYDSGDKDLEDGSAIETSSVPSSEHRNSLKKLISPGFFRKSNLFDHERGSKYHAYRVNDTLIIESEEGEVLRRYRINTHYSDKKHNFGTKKRSSGVVSKALNAVGIGRTNNNSHATCFIDSKLNEAKVAKASPQIPTQNQKLIPIPSFQSNDSSNEKYYDDSELLVSDQLDDAYEHYADDEDETAIERARRLTALGEYSVPRNKDDEEDVPATHPLHTSEVGTKSRNK